MRTRIRGPGGASTINLPDAATVGALIAEITEKTGLSSFDVKYGYPPKALLLKQHDKSLPVSELGVKLDGEQLTISARETLSDSTRVASSKQESEQNESSSRTGSLLPDSKEAFSFTQIPSAEPSKEKKARSVSLQRKPMEGEVPELPMPERGATLIMRVMPDDNSCLFRAFGTAVLPGDDQSMPELRSLVASTIQAQPDVYTKVILDNRSPDDYCRWIQTEVAWGGAIEMGILANHFDIEICSVDVKSLRVDKFNEGRPTRCVLVYSGIHYDTIVQSPSDPPHLRADNPPEFDKRVWDSDDNEILLKALELCKKLNDKHYFTDTGGMAIKCNICGTIVYGEMDAAAHAQQTNHYDMAEVKA